MRPALPIFAFLRRFARSERGNFAMILGLCAIPLLGIVGLGVDLTRAYIVQVRLQGAVDNAALAAATLGGQSDDVITAMTKKYFYSNYHADFWAPPAEPKVKIVDGSVSVDATATSKNYFLVLFGHSNFTVAASAGAVGDAQGLEVVLVLDITSSMVIPDPNKFTAMKNAAKDLVDILFGDEAVHSKLKIGVVPFAASVRLDPDTAIAEGWIDTTGASSVARLNFDDSLANNYAYAMFTQYMNGTHWQGCIEARPGALEESDTPPDASNPDTLWVPYFSPDNPDDSVSNPDYPNDYVSNDGSSGTKLERQRHSVKYQGQSGGNNFGSTSGPNRWCVRSTIQPLTNNKGKVVSAIEDLAAEGYTEIPLGVGWGWRVLSPGAPFTEGKSYSDPDWSKALIILTDGDNLVGDEWENYPASGAFDINGTTYTAYGFGTQYRVAAGTDTVAAMESALNQSLKRTCDNIKAVKKSDGSSAITIYTITYGTEVTEVGGVKDVMVGCASSLANYYDAPSKAKLNDTFHEIATNLSKIRLTK